MPHELRFSTENNTLKSLYDAIMRTPAFVGVIPTAASFYVSVEEMDPDIDDEKEGKHDARQEPGLLHFKATLHESPFEEHWKRTELWGSNLSKRGILAGMYSSEVVAKFGACEVIVPYTPDRNFYENVMIWWNFPCVREDRAESPIYASNILFLFHNE